MDELSHLCFDPTQLGVSELRLPKRVDKDGTLSKKMAECANDLVLKKHIDIFNALYEAAWVVAHIPEKILDKLNFAELEYARLREIFPYLDSSAPMVELVEIEIASKKCYGKRWRQYYFIMKGAKRDD